MLYSFCRRSLIVLALPVPALLSGCNSGPECDSIEARNAVLQIVSSDRNNPLVAYAIKISDVGEGSPTGAENAQPVYQLGQRMVPASNDGRTRQCSGAISVSIANVRATKEVEYTVQTAVDGKLSVSVTPFQF